MKRVWITFAVLVVAAGALLALVVWKATHPREPVYEGRTLTQWLDSHVPTSSANPPYDSPGWHKADEALRQIGTNAIPTLLQMIGTKDPPAPILKASNFARKRGWIRTRYRYAFQRNEEAEYAFRVLGTNAANAVPSLIDIYEDDVSASSHRCTALALGSIGRPAKAAIPALLKNFTHTNAEVRFHAVSAVYYIGGDPHVVIPAFRRALKDPHIHVRWNAVNGLATFGTQARSVVPDLMEALDDLPIREPVETALWRIAPETVGRPLVVGDSTPIVANGKTTAAIDAVFKGERHTWIRPGTPVPCVRQFFSSEPWRLRLYRSTSGTNDHFLGEFEVPTIPPPPATANVSLLCVITDRQIILCARDNREDAFVSVNRTTNESANISTRTAPDSSVR